MRLVLFQRIFPIEAGEAGEVSVVGIERSAIFDRVGSEDGVGKNSSGSSGFCHKIQHLRKVGGARKNDAGVGEGEPSLDGFSSGI